MSSHREAPQISTDPSADNTDVYAFVSPDQPDTVTLIANYIPFELPYGGPNFNEFSEDVQYQIKVSNAGEARNDITFTFDFTTTIRSKKTFLYNTGPISSPTDPNWNRPQTYRVTQTTRVPNARSKHKVLGNNLPCPPVNVGVHSTPDYPDLAAMAYNNVGNGISVFAGQRADGFHVDLGSIFDLGDLRPFQADYNPAIPPVLGNMPGVNGLLDLNVHTIAIQIPMTMLTVDGSMPTDVNSPNSVIGVWATASRRMVRAFDTETGTFNSLGDFQQISRLANPLVNEVINPMAKKDYWNSQQPQDDAQFADYVLHPELQTLIATVLYPAAFPNLAKYKKARKDLEAILLTGLPSGVVAGFQNYTGPVLADMLRLNMAVPPTAFADQNKIGLLAGDAAGFPNGRRPIDDVTAIELRAIAGLTIPLVDPSFTPDGAASVVDDGSTDNSDHDNDNDPYGSAFMNSFPYLSNPNSGFTSMPGTPGGELASNNS